MNLHEIELSALPWIFLEDRKQLPACAGIYIVTASDQILYVGCSENLLTRWAGHHRYHEIGCYDDVKIYWFVNDEICSLLEIEKLLIRKFQPILNGKPRIDLLAQKLALEGNSILADITKQGVMRLSLDLPISLHMQLKATSKKTGWKKAQIARIAIEKFLNQVDSESIDED